MKEPLPRVCFVCPDAYPILTGCDLGYTGGEEKRQVLLGQALAKRGLDVSFVTCAHSDSECLSEESIDDVRIIKASNRNSVGWLKKVTKHIWLYRACSRADGDVYLDAGSLVVKLFCLVNRRRHILMIASDPAATGKNTDNPTYFSNLLARLNVKLATSVVVQNEWQQEALRKHFRKESILIKNPIVEPAIQPQGKPGKGAILWVATIRQVKRPEFFLELAKLLPQYKFQMIGGPYRAQLKLYHEIEAKAKSIENLEFVGFVPPFRVDEYYQQASLLTNTSLAEGLPMTFLEAWLHGLPVITCGVDPGEVICRNRIGFHASSVAEMSERIVALMEDEEARQQMGAKARDYVLSEHNIDRIADQYCEVINPLVRR